MGAKQITFALVPGSFTKAESYDKCEALLHARGYNTIPIDLVTVNDGSKMPPASLEDDVEHIRSEILSVLDGENPSDVVLALASYSGFPGTAAVRDLNKASRAKNGKDTSVRGILYIAAHIPEVGESVRSLMLDNFPDLFLEPFKTGWPGEYMPAFPPEAMAHVYAELGDQAEIKRYGSMTLRHANDSFDGKCSFAGWAYDDIECVLILPELDQTIPVVIQEWMVKRRNGKIRVRRVEGAGHIVNVFRPDVVVEELIKIAQHC